MIFANAKIGHSANWAKLFFRTPIPQFQILMLLFNVEIWNNAKQSPDTVALIFGKIFFGKTNRQFPLLRNFKVGGICWIRYPQVCSYCKWCVLLCLVLLKKVYLKMLSKKNVFTSDHWPAFSHNKINIFAPL